MRVLLSSTPAPGHLFPLLPLARAAAADGHEVAVLTSVELRDLVAPLPVLAGGPSLPVILEETTSRLGGVNPLSSTELSVPAEFFAGARVDLSMDQALASARTFAPDLLVCEAADEVGPLVAAVLGVPWVRHPFGLAFAEPLVAALAQKVSERYSQRGLRPTSRLAYVDPCPLSLQLPGWTPPQDRLPIRPLAHSQPGVPYEPLSFRGREQLPRVLVTLGTTFTDKDVQAEVLASATTAEVNVVVTSGAAGGPGSVDADPTRVQPVGFVPLDQLLDGVSAVVTNAGAGTVIGALSRGLPLVAMPMGLDQPWNAARAEAAGAAIVVERADEIGPALVRVLSEPTWRRGAEAVAAEMAEMPSPSEVMSVLAARLAPAGL